MSRVEFDQPPINEVVCGALFEPLDLATAQFGRLWTQHLGEEFPHTADMPLLVRGDVEYRAGDSRVWFMSADQRYVLQLQRDRLHFNWRRTDDSDVYPRFDAVYAGFERQLAAFQAFAAEFGPVRVQVFELTYVNVIPLAERRYSAVGRVLPGLAWPNPTTMPDPESLNWAVEGPAPFGTDARMRVAAQIAQLRVEPERAVLRLELTVRGACPIEGGSRSPDQARQEWFEAAHQAIVRSFAEMTSNEAQTAWGRR